MTKQELIDHLRGNENFDENFKQIWISRIEEDGLTSQVIDELQTAVADQMTQTYASMGITDDENDPEYKAEYQKMIAEFDSIEKDLNSGVASLQEEGNQVFQSAIQTMEDDQAQAVRDSM